MENILAENMRRFGTKNLSEQSVHRKVTAFRLPSSRQVYKDFITKYLKDKLPNLTDDLKLSERIALLNRFMSNDTQIDSTQPIQYFRNLGYTSNDAQIKDFQGELGINQIKTQTGTGNFIDGEFGVGTVKAALQVLLDLQNGYLKNRGDKIYKDLLATPATVKAATK